MHPSTSRRSVRRLAGGLAATLLPLVAGCAPDESAEGDAPGAAPPAAASPATSDVGGTGSVAEYELTMEALRQWVEANRNLERVVAADPSVEAALEPEESEGQDVDASVAIMAERIEGIPAAAAAVEEAGLTPREYVVIGWTMLQSGMAGLSLKAGGDTAEVAREMGIDPANLRFMAEHEAEIAEIRRQMGGQ